MEDQVQNFSKASASFLWKIVWNMEPECWQLKHQKQLELNNSTALMQNSNGNQTLNINLVKLILHQFPYLENDSFLIKDNVGIHSRLTESTCHYFS